MHIRRLSVAAFAATLSVAFFFGNLSSGYQNGVVGNGKAFADPLSDRSSSFGNGSSPLGTAVLQDTTKPMDGRGPLPVDKASEGPQPAPSSTLPTAQEADGQSTSPSNSGPELEDDSRVAGEAAPAAEKADTSTTEATKSLSTAVMSASTPSTSSGPKITPSASRPHNELVRYYPVSSHPHLRQNSENLKL